MNYFVRRPWDLPQSLITEESIYRDKPSRREFVKALGLGGIGLSLASLSGCQQATLEEIDQAGKVEAVPSFYPAQSNDSFEYGRPETERRAAAEFCNFYEFATTKDVFRHVAPFNPTPWEFTVEGLCKNPLKFDMDDVYKSFQLEERAYRHRCVETWAMCVPWTGFVLADLLKQVEPMASAKYVHFETFMRPKEASQQSYDDFPWPYVEGLTIEEAMTPITFMATGIYGQPLPKQHGAPIRLVTPWKYGFKSIKSIVKIKLTDQQPATFWNTVNPLEYKFQANVEPLVPHPRWSQETEWMLGTYERYPSVIYNGYGDYVGGLYS